MGEWLTYVRFEPLTYFFKGVTFLGNEEFISLFLPAIYWCWNKREGAKLFILAILSAVIVYLIKEFFAWERPPAELWLIGAGGYTFPSSHAAMATAIWGYLALEFRHRWAYFAAGALIVLISLSRVYLGVHHPEDVIAGIAVGAMILVAFRFAARFLLPQLKDVQPVILGVSFFLINAGLLLADISMFTAWASGLITGAITGILIEPHFADFEPKVKWYQHILKICVGFLMMISIWYGFEWVLTDNIVFKWFEYFTIGNFVICGAPWIFVMLHLSHREA